MPPIRRVVTGHNDKAKAIVVSDEVLKPFDPFTAEMSEPEEGRAGFINICRTAEYPAKNDQYVCPVTLIPERISAMSCFQLALLNRLISSVHAAHGKKSTPLPWISPTRSAQLSVSSTYPLGAQH